MKIWWFCYWWVLRTDCGVVFKSVCQTNSWNSENERLSLILMAHPWASFEYNSINRSPANFQCTRLVAEHPAKRVLTPLIISCVPSLAIKYETTCWFFVLWVQECCYTGVEWTIRRLSRQVLSTGNSWELKGLLSLCKWRITEVTTWNWHLNDPTQV